MGYRAKLEILVNIYDALRESQVTNINQDSTFELEEYSPTIKRIAEDTDKYYEDLMPFNKISIIIGTFGRIYAIDDWILKNVKSVKDNEDYRISIEYSEVEALHKAITQVLEDNSKAEELIPLDKYFQNAGWSYDEFYFEGLKLFKESLDIIIELQGNDIEIYMIEFIRDF